MKKTFIVLFAVLAITFGAAGVQASTSLFDYAFNIDGTLTIPGDPLPGSVDASGFDFNTGLGTLSVGLTGAGDHNALFFVDHEIDEAVNTWFNETGSTSGTAAAGQSWEIDEPGWGSLSNGTAGLPYIGDIVLFNTIDNTLDNDIFYDAFDDQYLEVPDDVSMALGWDFTLASNEMATIDFIVGEAAGAGLNLVQHDPDSDYTLYFSSTLETECVQDCGTAPIPEPGTIILLGSGLAGLAGFRRKRMIK